MLGELIFIMDWSADSGFSSAGSGWWGCGCNLASQRRLPGPESPVDISVGLP